MTAEQLLAKHGIKLENTAPGRHYAQCPKCSQGRSRAHQSSKVLGVTIEADGSMRWGCNHCGWTGPEKVSGGDRRELTSYVYRDADGARASARCATFLAASRGSGSSGRMGAADG
jgi:hypothetical protein